MAGTANASGLHNEIPTDMGAMPFTTTAEHDAVRQSIQALCAKKIAPFTAAVGNLDRYRLAAVALGNSRYSAVHIPKSYGGRGAAAVSGCIVVEEVARLCATSSLIPICNWLATAGLILYGSEPLKQQVLRSIACGGAMASYSLPDREAGTDAAAECTVAQPHGADWVLAGSTCWIPNGGIPTWYTVVAVTEPEMGAQGLSAFVVHRDDPGFTVGAPERELATGPRHSDKLYFDDCHIPGDRLVGEPGNGFNIALQALRRTRLAIGAMAVGVAQGALDAALACVSERKRSYQHRPSIQLTHFAIADIAMKVEVARLMVHAAAARVECEDRDARFLSSAAAHFATNVAKEAATHADHLPVGSDCTDGYGTGQFTRDATTAHPQEGNENEQIKCLVMARTLLERK